MDTEISSCQYYHPDTGSCTRETVSSDSKLCFWHSDLVKDDVHTQDLKSIECADGFYFLGLSIEELNLRHLSLRRARFENSLIHLGESQDLMAEDSCYQETTFSYVQFIKCSFRASDWLRCDLNSTRFENCNLSGARWNDCRLESCDFSNSLLSKVRFQKTVLRNIDFSNTEFFCSDSYEQNLFPRFTSSKFHKCLFAARDLSFFQFHNCEFSHCDFLDSRFSRTLFRDCIFYEVNFSGSLDLDRAYFEGCSFQSQSLHSIRQILPDFGKEE